MPMKSPSHPGRILREEVLRSRGLTVTEAARALGVSRKHLSRLIHEHVPVSVEMAVRLGKAFSADAEFWLRLQAAHDVAQIRKLGRKIKVRRLPPAKELSV